MENKSLLLKLKLIFIQILHNNNYTYTSHLNYPGLYPATVKTSNRTNLISTNQGFSAPAHTHLCRAPIYYNDRYQLSVSVITDQFRHRKGSFTIFRCYRRHRIGVALSDAFTVIMRTRTVIQMSSLATTRTFFLGAAFGLVGMLAAAGTAIADSSLALDVDDAKLVKLAGEPSTVVVSNPMFADASIQGNKLIIIGKNTGRTKIIVLDFDGKQLANMMVNVQRAESQVVSVYRAGVRRTMNCEPFCDQPLIVNDDGSRFKEQSEQITIKTGLSAGEAARSGGAQ